MNLTKTVFEWKCKLRNRFARWLQELWRVLCLAMFCSLDTPFSFAADSI